MPTTQRQPAVDKRARSEKRNFEHGSEFRQVERRSGKGVAMVPVPKEPVSQVVFVDDYLQLVFHEERFNFYDVVEVVSDQRVLARGQPNFCDALVNLIGERAASVAVDDTGELTVVFDSGFALRVGQDRSSALGSRWCPST